MAGACDFHGVAVGVSLLLTLSSKAHAAGGPYVVDAYEGNSYLRLKANPNYFGGKPAFDTVIFKFVPDTTSRVAEIESGSSDVTLEIPYEDFDRLKKKSGLAGVATPISDIGMIFISNVDPMLDKNVRLAANMAIDKEAIIKRLLRGYGKPLSTLEAPEYEAYDASVKTPYDPEQAKKLLAASGYSPEKPVKLTIKTTRGFKPKDYEMIQAIVGMWRKVGIEAEIEVYEIAKHYELPVRLAIGKLRENISSDLAADLAFEIEGSRRHVALAICRLVDGVQLLVDRALDDFDVPEPACVIRRKLR